MSVKFDCILTMYLILINRGTLIVLLEHRKLKKQNFKAIRNKINKKYYQNL